MGLLGILSLLQIGIIPGVLITSSIKNISPYDRSLLVLPLSAIANYFMVIILTILGLYSQSALLLILATEVIGLIYCYKSNYLSKKYALDLSAILNKQPQQNKFIQWLVLAILFFFAVLALKQVGTVFTGADVVVSWNAWAKDWFNGISPRNTFHYPQLLPALYSISYQFIGTVEIELFAKLVPAFFPIMLMLTFLRMAALNRQNANLYLLALVLFWFSFSRMEGSQSAFNGYADIPMVYFVLVTIYLFNLAWNKSATGHDDNIDVPSNAALLFLSAIIISGGAITKHSALYLAALLPAAWYFHFQKKASLRQIFAAYAIILFVAGHWFIYKEIQIYSGADSSNLKYLSEIVALPWYAKLWHGVTMISSKISWLWIPLFIAGIFTPLGRAHAIWIFVPFFLLWSIFASYDYRNLMLALPSLAFILASGMIKFHEHFSRTPLRAGIYHKLGKALVLLLLSVIAYMLSTPKIASDLKLLNNTAKHEIGIPEFNQKLYAFFLINPEPGMIASTYYGLSHLPELKTRDLPASCTDLESLANNRTARYLIVESHCPEEISMRLASKYTKLFEGTNLIFYDTLKLRSPL